MYSDEFISAVKELRGKKSDEDVTTVISKSLMKRIVKDAEISATLAVVRQMKSTQLQQSMQNGDFSAFGDMSEQVQQLYQSTSEKKDVLSTTCRNANAALVTINPPPSFDPDNFVFQIQELLHKYQQINLHGSYFFEARQNQEPYGIHVHIVFDFREVDTPTKFKDKLISQCIKRKIWSKKPRSEQFDVKYSKHTDGYARFLKYADNDKKVDSDGNNVSTPMRIQHNIEDIYEF